MLIVELSNEAKDHKSGLYIMENGKTTNGRPHWLKGNYSAIWWDDEYSNWKIGKPASLGSSTSGLRSQSNNSACPNSPDISPWKYWDEEQWQTAEEEDVNIVPWSTYRALSGNESSHILFIIILF